MQRHAETNNRLQSHLCRHPLEMSVALKERWALSAEYPAAILISFSVTKRHFGLLFAPSKTSDRREWLRSKPDGAACLHSIFKHHRQAPDVSPFQIVGSKIMLPYKINRFGRYLRQCWMCAFLFLTGTLYFLCLPEMTLVNLEMSKFVFQNA